MTNLQSAGPNPAKTLFFDYLGSKFGMWHDGVLEEYNRYGISAGQEAGWRAELVLFWVERLSAEDVLPVIKLSTLGAAEALPEILKFASQGDSYVRLIYANALWEISGAVTATGVSPEVIGQAQQTALRLWRAIAAEPVVLTAAWDLKPVDGVAVEEYIKTWAAAKLARAEAAKMA